MKVLIDAASAAQKNAYCPYSEFKVGAAVQMEDGTIFSGCNVENSSYGTSLCAERNAMAAAVAAGHRRLKAVAVIAPFSRPCGQCRQFLAEFSDAKTKIVLVSQHPKGTLTTTVLKLLPESFNPRQARLGAR